MNTGAILALLLNIFLAVFAGDQHLPVVPKGIPKVSQFTFGDLIAMDFPSMGNPPVPIYIHWAVYVGKGKVEGLDKIKSDDEDIFHIYGGEYFEKTLCAFDKLDELSDKPEVLNYLDAKNYKGSKEKSYKPIEKKEMIKEIKNLYENCVWWDPILSNCEHVLAYVRYGRKQIGECKNPEKH